MKETIIDGNIHSVYPHLYEKWKHSNITTSTDLCTLADYPSSEGELLRIISSLSYQNHSDSETIAVVLAAGKGSRMGDVVPQKTLCPIHGKPALLHLIDTCKKAGVNDFIFIVGYGYKHVIEATKQTNICASYLFQDQALGTGHAARIASRYLHQQQVNGNVLVLMGDKWISQKGLDTLLRTHQKHEATLTLTAGRKEDWEDSGRLWKDEYGKVKAIIERADIVQAQMIDDFMNWGSDRIPSQDYLEKQLNRWNRPAKIQKLLGDALWDQLDSMDSVPKSPAALPKVQTTFQFNEKMYSGNEIEETCNQVNLSVYVFQTDSFYNSMEKLDNSNAQGEYYLTDAVQDLAANHTVCSAEMPNRFDIMGFNTPEELKRIEEHITATIAAENKM